MHNDLELLLREAAQTSREWRTVDTSAVWREGRSRRNRRRLITGSLATATLAIVAMGVVGLIANTPMKMPFIGQSATEHETTTPDPGSTGPVARPIIDPLEPGGELHCSGIEMLPPPEADQELRRLGYSPIWRFTDGSNTPYPDEYAPADSKIVDAVLESGGRIILEIVPGDSPRTAEADAYSVGCP